MVFFPVVVLVYWLMPQKIRYIWLLLASYYFYMSWNAKYALLIAFSTLVTYLSGLALERIKQSNGPTSRKKLVVAASFIVNLGILVFFKYSDFLLHNLNAVLSHLSIQAVSSPFDIVLPVGISFYTFQALGYTVDVYRDEIPAEKNILKYALFVSFFPQLVAGPIERSKNLLTQIDQIIYKKTPPPHIYAGLLTMLWGLFLKMVIADRAAILVNTVFDQYYLYGTTELLAGALAFSLQIYCDFASYSTIAIGAAQVMGFALMENFNTPYFAVSIKDFWRRWHISLSTWFRDYLYIPLGGSHCSKLRTYFNTMVTFLVSGLWHGASWHFVAWGGLHGAYQIAEAELQPLAQRFHQRFHVKTECFSYHFGRQLRTCLLVAFAWIFFRADGLLNALAYIQRLFMRWNPWTLFDGSLYTLGLDRFEMNIFLVSLLALFLVDLLKYRKAWVFSSFLLEQNAWFRWLCLVGLLISIVIYGQYGPGFEPQAFIYFQF
ncbi:MBOAT family protein [uncultured Oscillibacter sp.]|uniref:MBOAT family O-acyltransferase n=1 Tax=uncultured Oscillibacter sp. TaxID=876091 RepID=UPI00345DB7FC